MLRQLRIQNFAIIDQIELDFPNGLTTITGETGAGKSILLGALRLVLGERADIQSLKNKDLKSVIEAVFDLSKLNLKAFFEANDLDFDQETVLRREIATSGKSRAFINDTPVNLSVLNELGHQLIDIHSQFNTQSILDPNFHLNIIDAYADNQILLEKYGLIYANYSAIKKSILELENKKEKDVSDFAYKKFLLEEIQEINLENINYSDLEESYQNLSNVEEILAQLGQSYGILDQAELGLLTQIQQLNNYLQQISAVSSDMQTISERVLSVKYELEDIANEIERKIQKTEADPEKLLEISQKIDRIQALFRKHQISEIEDLILLQQKLESETQSVDQIEEKLISLQKELSQKEKELTQLADSLNQSRSKVIPFITKEIESTLSVLGMENSTVQIDLQALNDFGSTGKDQVLFLFSANKGMAPRSIEKAVSGGERSRLMLAIKKLLAAHQALPTLILDEIDTGISGKVANDTGILMREMAKNLQLVVITHLPQVAAKGNTQMKVFKIQQSDTTISQVKTLDTKERLEEIAQMISGSTISETALLQAKELLL